MVPTFCVPLGRAKNGDLPLDGEGGGEPKREPSSSSSSLLLSSTMPVSDCIALDAERMINLWNGLMEMSKHLCRTIRGYEEGQRR